MKDREWKCEKEWVIRFTDMIPCEFEPVLNAFGMMEFRGLNPGEYGWDVQRETVYRHPEIVDHPTSTKYIILRRVWVKSMSFPSDQVGKGVAGFGKDACSSEWYAYSYRPSLGDEGEWDLGDDDCVGVAEWMFPFDFPEVPDDRPAWWENPAWESGKGLESL